MKKEKNDKRNQKNEGMLKEKTNEDYNKQKPNPMDPNQENQNNNADWEDTKNKKKFKTVAASPTTTHSNNGNEISKATT